MKSLATLLLTTIGLAACASSTKQSQSLNQVDDLLTRVERVQVEATVAKDAAHEAVDVLNRLMAPEFAGEAVANYATLVESIEKSEAQARKLNATVTPMSSVAEKVFEQWTEDLQSFGNSKMRQRSQARLEDTRARYQAIMTTGKSAQIAYDAFNADLRDHALFLGHDFNAAAVAEIAGEVRAVTESTHELDRRLEACIAATRAYVESAALPGQVEQEKEEVAAPVKPVEKPTPAPGTRRKRAPNSSAAGATQNAPTTQSPTSGTQTSEGGAKPPPWTGPPTPTPAPTPPQVEPQDPPAPPK